MKRFIIHPLPVVSMDDTSPKGDGSIRKYFCGEDTGDIIGAHLLLLGDAGFISGSKSRVLLRVAPQAITPYSIYTKMPTRKKLNTVCISRGIGPNGCEPTTLACCYQFRCLHKYNYSRLSLTCADKSHTVEVIQYIYN